MENRVRCERWNRRRMAATCILFGIGIVIFRYAGYREQEQKTVLYSTDLAIDGDFDDYFDLVVMKSLKDIELKIIIDGNDSLQKQSGAEAVKNLEKIQGGGYMKSAEVIIGRDHNLEDMYDAGACDDLVKALTEIKGKADIVSVGSLRDIALLYNNSPDLFEKKIDRVWIFAGDAEGAMAEWNVALDETAFLRIMNSENLNIYWIPCFQNGIWTAGPNSSYFIAKHKEVLCDADQNLQKWFLYRFDKSEKDFQDYMAGIQNTDEFMEGSRNLWCAPLFPLVNGSMPDYLEAYNQEHNKNIGLPFGFSEKRVLFSEGGRVEYGEGNRIYVFEVYDYDEYVDFMKYILRCIYGRWSVGDERYAVKE